MRGDGNYDSRQKRGGPPEERINFSFSLEGQSRRCCSQSLLQVPNPSLGLPEPPKMSLILLGLGCVLCGPLLLGLVLWAMTWKYRDIPRGLGSPVFGNLYRMIESLWIHRPDLSYNRARHFMDMYAETLTMWFGPGIVVITSDPIFIEKLVNNPAAMNKEPLLYDKMHMYIKGAFSTSISDGSWRAERRKILQAVGPPNLKRYHELALVRAIQLVQHLAQIQGEFDISHHLSLCFFDVVLDTMHGVDMSILKNYTIELSQDFEQAVSKFIDLIADPRMVLVPACLLQVLFNVIPPRVKEMHEKVLQEIKKNLRKKEESKDETPLTMGERVVVEGIAVGKTQMEINIELRETFYEGALTMSRAASAACVFLAMHPNIQAKAWEEQKESLPDITMEPTYDDLNKMVYLERVLQESLRFCHPPVTARRVMEEMKVGNMRVPKNSTLLVLRHHAMVSPKYWDKPLSFNPDNFLPENIEKRPKSLSTHFGIPPRNCPGGRYGLNQAKEVLSAIIRYFELSTSLKPEDIKYRAGFLMEFDVPYTVSLKPRPR